ncbi:universal stress protein [Halobacteriales archaeon QS_1_67_19]|nr:MAG: universal stress protein [Halobacteriales archaeon QS_1_67_19]
MALFDHVAVPIASDDDAVTTAAALRPYLDAIDRVTAVHVIEKGGGAIDKAPMEQRRADATEFLDPFETELGGAVPVETRIAFGTDVAETIVEAATAADATAIAFRPRGGSRIVRLLTGDTATQLVTDPELPVISLPNPTED